MALHVRSPDPTHEARNESRQLVVVRAATAEKAVSLRHMMSNMSRCALTR